MTTLQGPFPSGIGPQLILTRKRSQTSANLRLKFGGGGAAVVAKWPGERRSSKKRDALFGSEPASFEGIKELYSLIV